ncbi:MAG: DNA polymerase domain-containing protein [Promethearchaeota archaeon]
MEDKVIDFRGSFPSMAAITEWPQLERDDPLVWPDAWRRPPIPDPLAPHFDLHSDIYQGNECAYVGENPEFGIAFQMVDITYSMYDIVDEIEMKIPHIDDMDGEDPETFPPTYRREEVVLRKEPEIRMFGTNAAGNSVCMRYRGFLPYLYIRMKPNELDTLSSSSFSSLHDYEETTLRLTDDIKNRLQTYMRKSKEEQERLRMASMHVEVFKFFFHRIGEEYSKLLKELIGEGEYIIEEEETDETISLWIKHLQENILCCKGTIEDALSLRAIGDRSEVCCPHWTRTQAIYPNMMNDTFRAQMEPRERVRHNKKKDFGKEPIHSFLKDTNFTSVNKSVFGVESPKVLCKMCLEVMMLVELLLQSSWEMNNRLTYESVKEEGTYSVKVHRQEIIDCYDEICKQAYDNVLQPLEEFNREARGETHPEGWKEDVEPYLQQYVSKIHMENNHQSMMACEEKDAAKKVPFLRVELFSPRDCTTIRAAVQYAGLLIHIPIQGKEECHIDFITTYESNIPFVLRFGVDYDISGMGWVYSGPRAWKPIPVWDPDRKSKCQIEVFIDEYSIHPDVSLDEIIVGKPTWQQMAPMVWVFFDDEMAGRNPNRMPRPNNLGDLICQSGVVMFRQNEKEPFESCIFSLGGSEPLLRKVNRRENITSQERDLYSRARIYTFGSECDLMLAWRRMIEIVCPDFLCGYNSVDFDLPYMVRRSTTGVAVGQDMHVAFRRLSKVIEHEHENKDESGTYWKGLTEIRKERFQSKAFGLRENDKATTTGMIQFDVLRVIRQNEKKRSYKLDKVTREELKDYYKLPLPHTEITPKATSPYDVMRSLLDRYCFMDAILPKMVAVDKKTYDIIYTEMARITGVTMDNLLGKGQRVKITQRLLKSSRRAALNIGGFSDKICPSPEDSPYSTKEPISFLIPYQRGASLDVNPSFYDTEDILEGEDDGDDHMKRGATYSGATVLKAKRGYYKEPTPTLDFSSLYPSIMRAFNICITTYLGTREEAEARYIHTKLGEQRGLKCAWDLRKDKDYRWTPFDAIPDGDFIVMPNGASFITRKHRVGLMCVDLGEILAARSQRKKMMAKYDKGSSERAAHNGAQLGLKVTANSMYGYTAGCNTAVSEAVTSTGRFLLKFTRDLVYERGQKEHRYFNEQLYGDSVTADTPVLLRSVEEGVISWKRIDSIVDESDYKRHNSFIRKENVVFNTPEWEIWTDKGWTLLKRLIRHKTKKPIYRVLTHTGVVDVTSDHSLLDHEGNEISPTDIVVGTRLLHNSPRAALKEEDCVVPPFSTDEAYVMGAFLVNGTCGISPEILMAPKEWVQAFFDGFYDRNGSKQEDYIRFCQKGKVTAAGLMFLAQRLDWNASINTRTDKLNIFRITLTTRTQKRAIDKVKKISLLRADSTEYVYDLETENHHFHVGPGDMIVHNTDSIMFRLFNVKKIPGKKDRYDLHEAAQIGVELAEWVTDIFQSWGLVCIVLAFEKVYETWMLKSKKCYAVYKHLFDVKTGKLTAYLSSSGMESVRRNVTLFTKELLEQVIKMTIQDRDLNGSIRLVQKMFTELKEGRVPIEKLIFTGGFSKRADQYKNPVAHIEAVRKQMDDDPNNAPTVGSRIDWVIACLSDDPVENSKAKVYLKAVMPDYLKAHNMRLDYEGYITKCSKTFCRFFAPALAPKMDADQGQSYVMRTVFEDYFRERDEIKKRKNSSLITSFARGFVREKIKKRKTSTEGQDGSGDDEKLQQSLLMVDPSRASFHKKRRMAPYQIRKERDVFSVSSLTTTEETLSDWMDSSGTTKKGTHYRQ